MSHPVLSSTFAAVLLALALQVHGQGSRQSSREGLSLLQLQVSSVSHVDPLSLAASVSPEVSDPEGARMRRGLGPLGLLHIPYNHIAVNLTYTGWKQQMFTFPERRPREFNIFLATIKTFGADLVVQFLEGGGRNHWRFDIARSLSFALFGFLYIGCAQWVLYVTFLTWLFPDAMIFANSPMTAKMVDRVGQIDMLGQIVVDNLFFNVFIYFPAFYILKAVVQGFTSEESMLTSIKEGLNKYRKNIVADNMASLSVWVPADLFIFAAPMYLRMPLEHTVSFGWTMFMSAMRGAAHPVDKSEKAEKSELLPTPRDTEKTGMRADM